MKKDKKVYISYMRINTREDKSMQKFAKQEKLLENYAQSNGIRY